MSHMLGNERGVFFPAVVILLMVVTIFLLSITAAYQSKYQTYTALENVLYRCSHRKNRAVPSTKFAIVVHRAIFIVVIKKATHYNKE